MKAHLVFFASIREQLGCDGLVAELPETCKVSDLVAQLTEEHGDLWRVTLTAENLKIAVNQELISGDPLLAEGDEVAFFPPVTGG